MRRTQPKELPPPTENRSKGYQKFLLSMHFDNLPKMEHGKPKAVFAIRIQLRFIIIAHRKTREMPLLVCQGLKSDVLNLNNGRVTRFCIANSKREILPILIGNIGLDTIVPNAKIAEQRVLSINQSRVI